MFRRSSEQPFDFTMQYLRHREPAYVLVNRSNMLLNTYLELAKSISLDRSSSFDRVRII